MTDKERDLQAEAIGYLRQRIAELEKENENLKIQRKYEVGVLEAKITKAKDIIKDYMLCVTGSHITVCSVPEENRCINVLKLNEQAEEFIKETE